MLGFHLVQLQAMLSQCGNYVIEKLISFHNWSLCRNSLFWKSFYRIIKYSDLPFRNGTDETFLLLFWSHFLSSLVNDENIDICLLEILHRYMKFLMIKTSSIFLRMEKYSWMKNENGVIGGRNIHLQWTDFLWNSISIFPFLILGHRVPKRRWVQ